MAGQTEYIPTKELLEKISTVNQRRPRVILEHLVKYGSITTEEITKLYNYDHAPRAIRDVREQGIPIVTTMINVDGKQMGKYTFGDPSKIENNKLGGRQVFSKKFKQNLVDIYGSRCGITLELYDPKYLQIDHRVPYEVGGEGSGDERTPEQFMLLCASAQRKKSWECEHCFNLLQSKNVATCQTCYWASPENYSHVAGRHEKQIDLVFQEDEIAILNKMEESAQLEGLTLKDYLLTHYGH